MQDERNQFKRNEVWDLIPCSKGKSIIGTKWVFRNKLDENGIIARNKARQVAKGYNQEEGIDYEETYAPVARLKSIRLLLAFASCLDFKLFQMNVKSAFLNGLLNEEVHVSQPPGFEDVEYLNHVYKLKRDLYGLKQASRAWYERLSKFLLEKGFPRGNIDNTLFSKRKGKYILLVQVCVNDIIFGSTNEIMCQEISKLMQGKFEMSLMGELTFFLGLPIKQTRDGIFLSQTKSALELLKKFDMQDCKSISTLMASTLSIDKDESDIKVDGKRY